MVSCGLNKSRYHDAVATVTVSGVTERKSRLHGWHDFATMLFAVVPCAIVTVGVSVEAMGIVKFCDTGCVFVLQHPPPHGT